MSEFSEKLRAYVEASGGNVMRLAEESGLERTTLQKMIRGQRVPSEEYVRAVCKSLMITVSEEEELIDLWQKAKFGPEVYETRQEIMRLLMNIQQSGRYRKLWEDQPAEKISVPSVSGEVTSFHFSVDVQQAIADVTDRELANEEQPEFFMTNCTAVQTAREHVIRSGRAKQTTWHEIVAMHRSDGMKASGIDSIQILGELLPFFYTFDGVLDIRYSYTALNKGDYSLTLWPFVLVTHSEVLQISGDATEAVLLHGEKYAKPFRDAFRRRVQKFRPLVHVNTSGMEALQVYLRETQDCRISRVIEAIPCVPHMFSREMALAVGKALGQTELMDAYFDVGASMLVGDRVAAFGMSQMREFMKTGRLPGIYAPFFRAETPEIRMAMLQNFRQHLVSQPAYFRLIREGCFAEEAGTYVELVNNNTLMFLFGSGDNRISCIVIKESGICAAFEDFMNYFIKSRYVYPVEDTLAQFDRMVQKLQEETRKEKKEEG